MEKEAFIRCKKCGKLSKVAANLFTDYFICSDCVNNNNCIEQNYNNYIYGHQFYRLAENSALNELEKYFVK